MTVMGGVDDAEVAAGTRKHAKGQIACRDATSMRNHFTILDFVYNIILPNLHFNIRAYTSHNYFLLLSCLHTS